MALIYGIDYRYITGNVECDWTSCANPASIAIEVCGCDCDTTCHVHGEDYICILHVGHSLTLYGDFHWDNERYPEINVHVS